VTNTEAELSNSETSIERTSDSCAIVECPKQVFPWQYAKTCFLGIKICARF